MARKLVSERRFNSLQGIRNSNNHTLSESRYDKYDHWIENDAKKSRSRCTMVGCQYLTHAFCSKCRIYLCFTRERNCFRDFHSVVSQQDQPNPESRKKMVPKRDLTLESKAINKTAGGNKRSVNNNNEGRVTKILTRSTTKSVSNQYSTSCLSRIVSVSNRKSEIIRASKWKSDLYKKFKKLQLITKTDEWSD